MPPPPEVPASLTRAVRAATPTPIWSRRRTALAAAIAAVLVALSAGLGAWLAGGSAFEAQRRFAWRRRERSGASALLRLGEAHEDGNWTLELETVGLPELPPGGYYVLWLAKDGEYEGTCGTFRTDDDGTSVRMNASYRLAEYDEWVVTDRAARRRRRGSALAPARADRPSLTLQDRATRSFFTNASCVTGIRSARKRSQASA